MGPRTFDESVGNAWDVERDRRLGASKRAPRPAAVIDGTGASWPPGDPSCAADWSPTLPVRPASQEAGGPKHLRRGTTRGTPTFHRKPKGRPSATGRPAHARNGAKEAEDGGSTRLPPCAGTGPHVGENRSQGDADARAGDRHEESTRRKMTNEELILAAIGMTPEDVLRDPAKAETAIARNVVRIEGQTSEHSLASRVLNSVKIPATVESVVLEPRSQRLVVAFRPDRVREGAPEVERARTDRVDGWRGQQTRELWTGLVGRHALLFKTTESTGDPSRPKVRVLVFAEPLG